MLERAYPTVRIHTSACDGKMVAEWRVPGAVAEAVASEITRRVQEEVEEVVARAVRRRGSDSLPYAMVGEIGG